MDWKLESENRRKQKTAGRAFLRGAITTFAAIFIFSFRSLAQSVEMADTFRSNGKIFVVVAVVLIIFIGISVYLVLLDIKSRKVEKQLKELKENLKR